MEINLFKASDAQAWDAYVCSHSESTPYHLSGWKNIIEKAYHHKTYYLIASQNQDASQDLQSSAYKKSKVIGILPLIHLKHFVFGNSLISMPFFDYGGILANTIKIEEELLVAALRLGKELGANNIELRHISPLSCLNIYNMKDEASTWKLSTRSHKVRMILKLPENEQMLMESFKSKLRNQIKRPIKEGCTTNIGTFELLDNFYKVFSTNMRDLGSPVHSKEFFRLVLSEFNCAKINVVVKEKKVLSASIIFSFNNTLYNPWSSSLRKYSRLSPNMLLYWTMLEFASKGRYQAFDFGRSTQGESTYNFKRQWGATPINLNWHYFSIYNHIKPIDQKDNFLFQKAVIYWQKLPVTVTTAIGPSIRKYIGL